MRGTLQNRFKIHWLRWTVIPVFLAACILSLSALAPAAVPAVTQEGERSGSQTSWFIDRGRFHASVHGQLTCVECHEAAAKSKPHPDPAHVDREAGSFFKIDQCVNCHDETVAKIESGTHAGKPVTDVEAQKKCVTCHDPHYQLSSTPRAASFNRARPVAAQCGVCHAAKTALPAPSPADQKCIECHGLPEAGDPSGVGRISRLCFACHGSEGGIGTGFAKIDAGNPDSLTHARLTCLACHPQSAEYGHSGRKRTECLLCHRRHDEKVAHDAHINVGCEACHLAGTIPVRKSESGGVGYAIDRKDGPVRVHQMRLGSDERSCEKCHYSGNSLGASAMVLPAKSVLCMPCHAATFSVGDTVTIVSLLVFLGGMGLFLAFLFSNKGGSASETRHEAERFAPEGEGTSSLIRIAKLADCIFWDILLQRRLYRCSKKRWFIHGLIFFPFLFRFLWGMAALLGTLYASSSPLTWKLVDKNDPVGALLFDVSGLMILAGVLLAGARWFRESKSDPAGLPRNDWPALCLIGAVVIVGFALEGMRIAMTGFPTGAGWSFAGYGLAGLFGLGGDWTGLYGYLWYLHAILTGAMFAYLPFSRLMHMIASPAVMVWSALEKKGRC